MVFGGLYFVEIFGVFLFIVVLKNVVEVLGYLFKDFGGGGGFVCLGGVSFVVFFIV